jgi:hypothetical protein
MEKTDAYRVIGFKILKIGPMSPKKEFEFYIGHHRSAK